MGSLLWVNVLLKFVATAALAEVILPVVSGVGWLQAPLLAAVLTALSYAFVDRRLMAAVGNEAAVLADFALAVLVYWLLPPRVMGVTVGLGAALTAGGAFAIAEIVFHQYLLRSGVGVR